MTLPSIVPTCSDWALPVAANGNRNSHVSTMIAALGFINILRRRLMISMPVVIEVALWTGAAHERPRNFEVSRRLRTSVKAFQAGVARFLIRHFTKPEDS